jgi:hypothetical protein
VRSRLLTLFASAPQAEAPGVPYRERLLADHAAGLLVYWPLDEASGTTAADASGNNRNGSYVGAGVTLGVTGIGDGRTAMRCAGTTNVMTGNASANGLNTAFGAAAPTAGTIQAWVRITSSGVWTDAAARYALEIIGTAQNRISLLKSTTSNTITLAHRGSNVLKQINATLSDLLWHHLALTWDTAADQLKAYVDGVQSGSTVTGLGTWTGNALVHAGAQNATGTSGPWSGDLAHPAIWSVAKDATAIADLATVNP